MTKKVLILNVYSDGFQHGLEDECLVGWVEKNA